MKDRIVELANELAQELINHGYDTRAKDKNGVIPGYLAFDIDIHNSGNKKVVYVQNINQGWKVKGEYTGTGFESREEN